MKIIIPLIGSILILSCEVNTSNASKQLENKTPTSKDTCIAACKVCLIQNELVEIEKKIATMGLMSKEERDSQRARLDLKTDSLKNLVQKLTDEFGVDYKNSQLRCSSLYPTDKIKDEMVRDSVFYELELWNFDEVSLITIGFPLIDTAVNVSLYEGKYAIKYKGEIHLLTKEEYDVFISNYFYVKKKIEDRILMKRKELVSQLTGISDPDNYCMEMTSRKANQSSRTRDREKFRPGGIYLDEEIISLIKSATKFE